MTREEAIAAVNVVLTRGERVEAGQNTRVWLNVSADELIAARAGLHALAIVYANQGGQLPQMEHGHGNQPPDHRSDHDQHPPEHAVSLGMLLEIIGRHHRATADYIAAQLAAQTTDLKAFIHQEIQTMSASIHASVDHVAAAVAALKAEVQTDVAAVATMVSGLKQQIADLLAAGTGGSPEDIASLDASATDLEATVTALHDGLNPPPPAPDPAAPTP